MFDRLYHRLPVETISEPRPGLWGKLLGPKTVAPVEVFIRDVVKKVATPTLESNREAHIDKAWDVIGCALQELIAHHSIQSTARNALIEGGVDASLPGFSVVLKSVDDVKAIGAALAPVTGDMLMSVREVACKDAYIGDAVDDEDEFREYVCGGFEDLKSLYSTAAAANRPVVLIIS